MLHPMEPYMFWMIICDRGHHWKGIQILYANFATLSEANFQNLSIFKLTKCFCNFMITKKFEAIVATFKFFLWNFYLHYLFKAALYRLLLEVGKVCSSIASKLLFCSLSWMSWRLNIKIVWLDVTKGLSFSLYASSNKPRTGNMKQKLCFRYWTICYC